MINVNESKKQVTILLGEKANEKIQQLKEKRGSPTTSAVLRDALTVLSTLENLKSSDGTITIAKDGEMIKYQFQ